jgi:hypothetical protein
MAVMRDRTGRRVRVWRMTEPEIIEAFNGGTTVAYFKAAGLGDGLK